MSGLGHSRRFGFQKNDAAEAEAICEAVTGANMRFVETKTPEQQSGLMLHRTRLRAFDRDLIRGGHYGQRSCEPR
jgi:transposase